MNFPPHLSSMSSTEKLVESLAVINPSQVWFYTLSQDEHHNVTSNYGHFESYEAFVKTYFEVYHGTYTSYKNEGEF